MLYRPNFCCQCGEKIARAKWTLLTSRRFCEFCEVEQKEHELLPRVAFVLAIFIGAAGMTAYMTADARHAGTAARIQPLVSEPEKKQSAVASPAASPSSITPPPGMGRAESVQREAPANSSIELVYYCGAITRKGTPCTRRVKTKGLCWQHADRSAASEPPN